MNPETPVQFPSGDVILTGRIRAVSGADRACVVCHPHPLYGGDMHNPVVAAITREFGAARIATLRFDFRGTGSSGGAHEGGNAEIEDARAAIDTLAAETGLSRVAIAGYSFGAFIAICLAAADERISSVVAVAPPLAMPGFACPRLPDVPFLWIAGDRDTYCPARQVAEFAESGTRSKTHFITGADHFFTGREHEIAAAARDFLAGS